MYWQAKKEGTLPEGFGYSVHVKNGKKGEIKANPTVADIEKELKRLKKKGKKNPQNKYLEQLLLDIREEEGGEDPKA